MDNIYHTHRTQSPRRLIRVFYIDELYISSSSNNSSGGNNNRNVYFFVIHHQGHCNKQNDKNIKKYCSYSLYNLWMRVRSRGGREGGGRTTTTIMSKPLNIAKWIKNNKQINVCVFDWSIIFVWIMYFIIYFYWLIVQGWNHICNNRIKLIMLFDCKSSNIG